MCIVRSVFISITVSVLAVFQMPLMIDIISYLPSPLLSHTNVLSLDAALSIEYTCANLYANLNFGSASPRLRLHINLAVVVRISIQPKLHTDNGPSQLLHWEN